MTKDKYPGCEQLCAVIRPGMPKSNDCGRCRVIGVCAAGGALIDAKDARIAELEKGLYDLRHAWAQHALQPYLGVESWQAAAAAMAEARAVQEGTKK